MMRAWAGWQVLQRLGFDASISIGGLVYRVGPDPRRDVIAFGGRYNAGLMVNGYPLFHTWNEVDADLIDFSVGDWRTFASAPDTWMMEQQIFGETLGPLQWRIPEPPAFWWRPIRNVRDDVWNVGGTPELGRVWYGPITQDAAEVVAQQFFAVHAELKDELGPVIEMMLRPHFSDLHPVPVVPKISSTVLDVAKLEAAIRAKGREMEQ
jgi:hypothetical protein